MAIELSVVDGMSKRIRTHDWSAAPLGDMQSWPLVLRTASDLMLSQPLPSVLCAGDSRIVLYNDAYAALIVKERALPLGLSASRHFAALGADFGATLNRVYAGQSEIAKNVPLANTWFDFSWSAIRDSEANVVGAWAVAMEVSDGVRQSFLLQLADALNASVDPNELQLRACRALATWLDVSRVSFADIDGRRLRVQQSFSNPALPLTRRFELPKTNRRLLAAYRRDRTVAVSSFNTAPWLTSAEKLSFQGEGIEAFISRVLFDHERAAAVLAVHHAKPREWSAFEIELVGEVAERTFLAVKRTRAELELREREEQQALLIKLSDLLHETRGPSEAMFAVAKALGEHLGASGAAYLDVGRQQAVVNVERDWVGAEGSNLAGRHALDSFGFASELLAGEAIHVDDVARWAPFSEANVAAFYGAINVRAFVSVPVLRGGSLVGALFVSSAMPRPWTYDEIDLIEAMADRTRSTLERALTETALLESEDRYRTLFETMEEGFCIVEPVHADAAVIPEFVCIAANPALIAIFRLGDLVGKRVHELFPGQSHEWRELFAEASSTGLSIRSERELAERGTVIEVHAFRLEGGPQVRVGVIVRDITERIRNQRALLESEMRFRQFGEASTDVLWIRNAETLEWEYLSKAFESIYGASREQALRGDDLQYWVSTIVEEDRERVLEQIARVRRGEHLSFEFRIRRPEDGEIRWLRNTDFPVLNEIGSVMRIGGIGQDITEEKAAASRSQVLVSELQHRTRNLVAVTQSLADRTLAESKSLEDFKARFTHRLAALSRVQGLLSRLSEGERVTFDQLLNVELAAIEGLENDRRRIEIEGPSGVQLRSSGVQTLALAIHELITNSLKYGALASSEGLLSVTWNVSARGEKPQVRLWIEWRESGVKRPANAIRHSTGYGRELIERALPYQLNAATSYELEADGVHCTIELPLSA